MNPFQTRPLGRTSLSLTVLGCGGSAIGNLYHPVSEEEASDTIEAAYAAGVRYFDTAPLYANGLGEHRMGRDLRRYGRETYVLSTKVGLLLRPLDSRRAGTKHDPRRLPFEVVHEYGYDGVMRSTEDSLQRLGMNRIDIALIHDVEPHHHGKTDQKLRFPEAMDGGYRALRRLRDEGTITAVGVGVNDWKVCLNCLAEADFDCFLLAGRYTLLDQSALGTLLPACLERGCGVIIGAPFNSGILARGATDGATYFDAKPARKIVEKTRRMERICESHGVTLSAAALRFPFGHAAVVSVIPGVRSAAHVARNIRAFQASIPRDLWLELKEEGLIADEAPLPEA